MTDIARYYTRGVRFPRLIGRTHDGTRIPGGPYTMAQGVGGLTVFLAGEATRSLWGGNGLLGDYSLLLGVVAATVVALRFLRTSGRDPLTASLAVLGMYSQPRHGRLDGRPVRLRRPHLARGRVTVLDLRPRAYDVPEPARATVPAIQADAVQADSVQADAVQARSVRIRAMPTSGAKPGAAPNIGVQTDTERVPSAVTRVVPLSNVGRLLAAASADPGRRPN